MSICTHAAIHMYICNARYLSVCMYVCRHPKTGPLTWRWRSDVMNELMNFFCCCCWLLLFIYIYINKRVLRVLAFRIYGACCMFQVDHNHSWPERDAGTKPNAATYKYINIHVFMSECVRVKHNLLFWKAAGIICYLFIQYVK